MSSRALLRAHGVAPRQAAIRWNRVVLLVIIVTCWWGIASATQNMSELVSDETTGLQPMKSYHPLLQYIKSSASTVDEVTILLECTFIPKQAKIGAVPPAIKVYAPGSTSPTKRARPLSSSASDTENENHSKVKKPKLEFSWPEGLHVIPSPDPKTPLNLLPPSFVYSSILNSEGVVLVDKTAFLCAICEYLNKSTGCFLVLPPKTGKTTFMSMLSTFIECHWEKDAWERLFLPLAIGQKIRQRDETPNPRGPVPQWSKMARNCLCLLFDLTKIEKATDSEDHDIARAIEKYLCGTMEKFLIKYEAELDVNIMLSPQQRSSPTNMIEALVHAASSKQRNIFVGVDHWDAPVLESLSFLGDDPATNMSASVGALTQFIGSLIGAGQIESHKETTNILVIPKARWACPGTSPWSWSWINHANNTAGPVTFTS
ncbi:hypothetical protein C8R47DRAFT_1220860 [Mycena vitilis]|nr:hypothetical protein C8R47DRAFT_1220860 [Mycena vitilis]